MGAKFADLGATPAAPSAPLFSLAFDDSGEEEEQALDPRREEQAPHLETPRTPSPSSTPSIAANPRAALAATLAGHVAELLAAGDTEAAKVAGDAMMRLLGADTGQGAPVIDLATRRERGR